MEVEHALPAMVSPTGEVHVLLVVVVVLWEPQVIDEHLVG